MKYKDYSHDTTQEQRIEIEKLKAIIKEQTGLDINKVSRKREVVMARKAYYKLLNINTKITYSSMANSVGKTHATALHALRDFDYDYKTDKQFKELYDNLFTVYIDEEEIDTTENLVDENLKLQEIIRVRNSEIEEQRNKLNTEIQTLKDTIKELKRIKIEPRNQQATVYSCYDSVEEYIR